MRSLKAIGLVLCVIVGAYACAEDGVIIEVNGESDTLAITVIDETSITGRRVAVGGR